MKIDIVKQLQIAMLKAADRNDEKEWDSMAVWEGFVNALDYGLIGNGTKEIKKT